MRSVSKGDLVSLQARVAEVTPNGFYTDSYSFICSEETIEIIERPWKVGDRFSRYDTRWVISATQNGYYWAWEEEEAEPCSFNEHDMKEAVRLQD